MDARISFVTLGVADMERSIRFYAHTLGLPQRGRPVVAPAIHRLEDIRPGEHGVGRGKTGVQLNRLLEIGARLQVLCTTLESVEMILAEQKIIVGSRIIRFCAGIVPTAACHRERFFGEAVCHPGRGPFHRATKALLAATCHPWFLSERRMGLRYGVICDDNTLSRVQVD